MSRGKRWEHLNDFKKNDDGKYEYRGSYRVFAGDKAAQKKEYALLWALLAAAVASSVGSGCISGAGITNTFYVILPFLGEICCLFVLTWNHCKILTKSDKIKSYIFKSADSIITYASAITVFFAVAGFITSLIFSVSTGFKDGTVNAAVYLALKILCAASALIYRARYLKCEWIEI